MAPYGMARGFNGRLILYCRNEKVNVRKDFWKGCEGEGKIG